MNPCFEASEEIRKHNDYLMAENKELRSKCNDLQLCIAESQKNAENCMAELKDAKDTILYLQGKCDAYEYRANNFSGA